MATFKVSEEYGVCSMSNETVIETTTLYSCSAIIMLNAEKECLGLYHYPALSLSAPGVQGAIIKMINDIVPTEIVLWKANPRIEGYTAGQRRDLMSIRLDNAEVKIFLEARKQETCTLTVVSDRTFSGVKCANKALVFERGSASPVHVPSSETIQRGDDPVLRVQKGNIWFYFGSGAGAREYAQKIGSAVQDQLEIEHN